MDIGNSIRVHAHVYIHAYISVYIYIYISRWGFYREYESDSGCLEAMGSSRWSDSLKRQGGEALAWLIRVPILGCC